MYNRHCYTISSDDMRYKCVCMPADWDVLHAGIIHHPAPQPSWNDRARQGFVRRGARQIVPLD
jgi:hypothetical protein